MEGAGFAVTLISAAFATEYGYSTPKGGYKYMVIEARVENVGGDEGTYGASRFSARDLETDALYDDTFTFGDGALGSGELSPGEYAIGVVVLEVQETATRVRVKYDPAFFDERDLYWVVE